MLSELNQIEIRQVLETMVIGRLGCTDGVKVYIVPIFYRLKEDSIICFSLEGQKIELMRKNPSVCFEVDQIRDANHWKCVIINGIFEEITDKNDLAELRPHYNEYFLRKRATLNSAPTINGMPDTHHTDYLQVFFRIRFKELTGRSADGID